MTEARDIAKPLREFMNKYKFTASDIMRGLVVIINGKQGKNQPAVLAEPCTT